MSGGHFDYKQFHITDIVDKLKATISRIEDPEGDNEWLKSFDSVTVHRLKEAVPLLEMVFVYVHRIDWLLSADDGEDQFHGRLQEEIDQIVDKVNKGEYQ